LFIKRICSLNKSFSFFVKNSNSSVLSEAFLFPFAESSVILVNSALLSLSEFLVFTNLIFLIFIFSFNTLILHNNSLNFLIKFSNFCFFVLNFNSNSSNLFGNFLCFVRSLVILSFQDIQFVVKTGNDVFLTLYLTLEIALEISEADVISLFASFKILNLSFESHEVSFI